MPNESFRFLHASDLHLEQPPGGLREIPDHLHALLADAPLEAAARVFEAAVVENVEFVVLAGDVVNPRTGGARAIALLMDQLEMLAEQKIPVYWCGGREDAPDRWPDDLPLPDNVHRFPKGKIHEHIHARGSQALATVIGTSAPEGGVVHGGDFRIEPTNRFTVAVAYGQADAGSLAGHKQIDYWALGGRHEPASLFESPRWARYAGSPQGRCPEELGPHGCTLVEVDSGRKVRTRFVPTDVVRWYRESIALDENAQRSDLQRILRTRMQKIASETSGTTALVVWRVEPAGELARSLRSGGLDRELLDWLRTEFGRARPAVWTVSLDVESAAAMPEDLYEEDTILGDFLRAVREHEQDPKRALDFARFLPDLGKNRALASAIGSVDAEGRTDLLRAAALLGVDLLRGEELCPIAERVGET